MDRYKTDAVRSAAALASVLCLSFGAHAESGAASTTAQPAWQTGLAEAQLQTGLLTESSTVTGGLSAQPFRSGHGGWQFAPSNGYGRTSTGRDFVFGSTFSAYGDRFVRNALGETRLRPGVSLSPQVGQFGADDRFGDRGLPGINSSYSFVGTDWDVGLSVQHDRSDSPYLTHDASGSVREVDYPENWRYGGDVGFNFLDTKWRFEAAYLSDVPISLAGGELQTSAAVNYGGGIEFDTGNRGTRVNLGVTRSSLLEPSASQGRRDSTAFQGALITPLSQDGWQFNVRLSAGLEERDYYINPELRFIGTQRNEFYLQAHYFNGESQSLGGYYEDKSSIAIGWRSQF